MDIKTILLVEDKRTDEELMLHTLRKSGLKAELVVARDGAEAIDYLFARGKFDGRNLAEGPDLVLLDLNLPKIPGMEVLHQIRANDQTKYLPVVILTSSKEERDSLATINDGACDFISKPIEMTRLNDIIKKFELYLLMLEERERVQARAVPKFQKRW